jgi:hypothetical protein
MPMAPPPMTKVSVLRFMNQSQIYKIETEKIRYRSKKVFHRGAR